MAAKDEDARALSLLVASFRDEDLDPRAGTIAAPDIEAVFAAENERPALEMPAPGEQPPASKWPVLAHKFQTAHKGACTAAAFSRDGSLLATASDDSSIKISDVGRMLSRGEPHANAMLGGGGAGAQGGAGAAGPLGSSSQAQAGPPVLRAYADSEPVSALLFHPYLTVLASANKTSVSLFNYGKADVKRPVKTLPSSHPVLSMAFHPTGDFLLVGTEHHVVRLYDVASGQCYMSPHEQHEHVGAVTSLAFSSNGSVSASASTDGSVKIWETVSGVCGTYVPNAHQGAVHSVAFSRCTNYLVSAGADSTVRLWDLRNTARPVHVLVGCDMSRRASRASFSQNEDFVICAETSSSNVIVWNARTSKIEARFNANHTKPIAALAASPAADYLATGSVDGTVKFWAPATSSVFA